MKLSIDKLSNGNVWTFRPTSKKVSRLMHKLFPRSLWSGNGDRMMVEHRYEVEVAQALVERGVSLMREEDGAALRLVGGRFVLDAVLVDALKQIEEEASNGR